MNGARFLVAVIIVLGAALAACSGNFGSGTGPPNGLLPSGNLAGISPTPTPTPNSANNIVSYGTSADFQPLPNVAGYGGAVAFPVPSPKLSAEVAIGATLSVLKPEDAPDLNLLTKDKKGKKRERPARALAYLTLLATHDVTLSAYPRIAIDVPRDIVTIYRENELGLALYNSGAKDETFKLAVAELDTATPPPTPSPNPSAPPPPTAIPVSATASPSPTASGATPAPGATLSPRPSGAPTGPSSPAAPTPSPTLPPQRITFAGTAATLKMTANRPVVFALYALPIVTPSPSPHASGSAPVSAPQSSATGSAAPVASGTPLPAGSPVATGAPSPAGT
ncbi:MAG TPA: hypothetical protein VGP41_07730 [Candidatus Lustribacter sp.]|jgi:hypothetical protein|nr:hypothetical protein [Candidatus Lustribacter sp.]